MSTTFRMSTKNVLAPEIVVNNDRISKKVFTFHNCIIFPRKKKLYVKNLISLRMVCNCWRFVCPQAEMKFRLWFRWCAIEQESCLMRLFKLYITKPNMFLKLFNLTCIWSSDYEVVRYTSRFSFRMSTVIWLHLLYFEKWPTEPKPRKESY